MDNKDNLLDSLNPAQRAAVESYDGASLIVAGAGSGKTRVLTSRIAYMLRGGVLPWRVMALTFTNKAAAEMRDRIAKMVGQEQAQRLWMGTFHSIFLKILRIEAPEHMGYPSAFTIYDAADSRNLIKHIIREKGLADDAYKPAAIQARISLAKNNLITAQAYAADTAYRTEDEQRKQPAFADIYAEYARRCKQNGAMDFDDLLVNINILFKDFPQVLKKWQERFDYILVDEYQDTNFAQYIIIRRLADGHKRVCVVGDDAQSIYSFRGAKIENILRFRSDFPSAQTFKLEQNYRSTQNIVGAANSVIEKNENRLKKESFSAGNEGEKIKVLKNLTDREEAVEVAGDIRSRASEAGVEWSDFAILYRTNAQSLAFEDALRRRAIPYRIYGGMSFYQRKEVKDVLAYMRLVANRRDDEAFRRVVNYPTRGIGDVTVRKLVETASVLGVSLWEAATNSGNKNLRDFVSLVDSFKQGDDVSLYEFGQDVVIRSGIRGVYEANPTPENESALENIGELLNSMNSFIPEDGGEQDGVPTLAEWLQSITLITDQDNEEASQDCVTLMTIHAAKGLEYRFVYVVGMEDGLFPSQRSTASGEELEEERRLFYVALTRAKEVATLSHCSSRFKWGSVESCRPSRFLKEIDPQFLDLPEEKEAIRLALSGSSRDSEAVPTPTPAGNFKRVSAAKSTVGSGGELSEGQRVKHIKFGAGTVVSVENPNGDIKVTVNFDNEGTRTLLARFAKLAVI